MAFPPGTHRSTGARTRERLLAAIQGRPGLHKSALCAELGLAWGTVDYHLRVLARQGLVSIWPAGRETRCFPGGLHPRQKALLSALADGCGSRIALLLRHFPGRGIGEMSEQLGLSSKVVRRRLLRMVEDGMVQRTGTHRPRYSFGSGVVGLFEEVEGAARPSQPPSEPAEGPAEEPPMPLPLPPGDSAGAIRL